VLISQIEPQNFLVQSIFQKLKSAFTLLLELIMENFEEYLLKYQ